MTRRPPTSDGDRALAGRGRARTPPAGVPVDPLAATTEDLDASYDDLTPPPVMVAELRSHLQSRGDLNVEHLEMAEAIAVRVMQSVLHMHQLQSNRLMQVAQAAPGSERTHQRLSELETFRDEFRKWRLGLTGAGDENGRLGKMDRTIAELRKDVGTSEEAADVRGVAKAVKKVKAWNWLAIGAALLGLGGGGYGVITRDEARDAAVRSDARMELRLEVLEQGLQRQVERIDRVLGRLRGGAPDSDPTRNP